MITVQFEALDHAMGQLQHGAIFGRDHLCVTATHATLTVATPRAAVTVPCVGTGEFRVRVAAAQRFGKLLARLPAGSVALTTDGGRLALHAGSRVFHFTPPRKEQP